MAIIRLQGNAEIEKGIYYEFDTSSAPLGEGGMGKVFRGKCIDARTGLSKDVAIKFMFDGLAASVIERARREASIQIKSDNLVEMMGFLTTEEMVGDGKQIRKHYHVVSELLTGVTLSELLKGVTTTTNGQSIPYAAELYELYKSNSYEFAAIIIRNVLSGLMALHDAGYIHRDIDPSNIMITIDRKIKLIDFGIAKHITTLATQDKALTSAGQFIGKAQYAAPELVLGDVLHQDRTTDIYAIGIMFFQLITGRLPFDGPTTAIISAQLKTKINLNGITNRQARKIIAHATEKDQTKRYGSAAEFRVDIERLNTSGKGGGGMNTGAILKWGGGALAVIAIVVIGFLFFNNGTTTDGEKGDTAKIAATMPGEEKLALSDEMKDIVKRLYNPETAQQAWKDITDLYKDETASLRAEAMFVMSRVYFDYSITSEKGSLVYDEEVNADEVFRKIQQNLSDKVAVNQETAHMLLLECTKANPEFYPALYEIAWDYVWGDLRGTQRDAVRDAQTLINYLDKTKKAANANGNAHYADRVDYTYNTYLDY